LIAAHAWHPEIEHNRIQTVRASERNPRRAIRSGENRVALGFKKALLKLKNHRVIVNAENSGHSLSSFGSDWRRWPQHVASGSSNPECILIFCRTCPVYHGGFDYNSFPAFALNGQPATTLLA
jgi:hypothetical protein